MRITLLLCGLVALAGCGPSAKPDGNGAASTQSAGPVKGLDRTQKGKPAPDVAYLGPDGDESRLTDYRGPVLVNFWASWCAPCVKELPTLNALARRHAERGGLEVVALNQDSGPQGSIEAFYDKLDIDGLGLEQDPEMKVSGALGVQVLPTTILFNQGKEVWRYVGELDWNSPEAARLLAEAGVAQPG